jgi:hypothetical protein
MTQLLLDSNYLPLILKMFAHQDIDQAVAQQNDRQEFRYGSPYFSVFYLRILLAYIPPAFSTFAL